MNLIEILPRTVLKIYVIWENKVNLEVISSKLWLWVMQKLNSSQRIYTQKGLAWHFGKTLGELTNNTINKSKILSDRGSSWPRNQTRVSCLAGRFFSEPLGNPTEKAVATHSSILAWKIPWVEEPSGLQSTGWRRVGHGWAISRSLFIFMHWRRKWQPTPVFLSGESQGQQSLAGCRLWGSTESDMTEAT